MHGIFGESVNTYGRREEGERGLAEEDGTSWEFAETSAAHLSDGGFWSLSLQWQKKGGR